jgi:hypothetical protein
MKQCALLMNLSSQVVNKNVEYDRFFKYIKYEGTFVCNL